MAKLLTVSPANIRRKNPENSTTKINEQNNLRDSVINMSFTVALYYIPFNLRDKLKQEALRGLPKSYLIPPSQPLEICLHVTKLCMQLENENISFFENLPHQMNIKPENAKVTFISLSEKVLCHDHINWGRIVSIYTLAGVLAVHFVKKGHHNLAAKIPYWIKEVMELHLADWIVKQGGWECLMERYGNTKSSWSSVFTLGIFAAAGLLFYGIRK